ncbi:hypothetical protein C2G38_2040911 [Gigaspora rosea]|uniref:Uncharacterized protein n=1 Tax=Gigaspora rosea TaxID=44941 RepID=A0A397UXR4_9GLOM|nr:hypothetical protein C2G38_2040911 [Gigaspora rosea]
MNCEENLQTMEDDNLEYYYGSDYKTMHINWEQESQSESSRVSTRLSKTAELSPSIQTVLGNKEKVSKPKRPYKRKQPSFTWDYFEKDIDRMGEEVQICKILDESGQRYNQKYKNVGSSTGNLIGILEMNIESFRKMI